MSRDFQYKSIGWNVLHGSVEQYRGFHVVHNIFSIPHVLVPIGLRSGRTDPILRSRLVFHNKGSGVGFKCGHDGSQIGTVIGHST